MKSDIQYVEVTKHDRALVGKPKPGTRIFHQSGPAEESGVWFERLTQRYPGESFVSPGGVSMFAPVSRAAVYLRINSGKLTAFCYHPSKFSKTLFGGVRKSRTTPYVYIPVSECKAWAKELKDRLGGALTNDDFSQREIQKQQEAITDWPRHEGKMSPPKLKRKLKAAQRSARRNLLSVFV